MKKIYSLVLMTMLCAVTAMATVRTAGTYDELISALSAANDGDEIQLTADIAYASNNQTAVAKLLNIKKSITLDGLGHTISGYWKKSANNFLTLAINYQGTEMIDVTLQNLTITNNVAKCRGIMTFGNLSSLTLENCNIILEHATTPFGIFFIGNHQDTPANVTINNSTIANTNEKDNGNPLMINVPINLTMNNSTTQGWRAMYFKYARTHEGYECDGARGTVITANSCLFEGINNFESLSSGSSVFYCEDDGITFNLHNCGLCAEQKSQAKMYVLGYNNTMPTNRREYDITLNISGDNSYVNGPLITGNLYTFRSIMTDDPNNLNWSKYQNGYYYLQNGNYYKKASETPYANDPNATFDPTMQVYVNITGGTFSYHPQDASKSAIWLTATAYNETTGKVSSALRRYPKIPAGYEVRTMTTTKNGETITLYRVRETISEGAALNDNDGQNEDKNIQVTENITVANEETKAEYVEVKGGTDSDPVVTVTVPEGKTLEVSNGMDVTGNAEVVVEPGSTLSVGEGGLITEKPENIVISADETGAASLLLDPAVVVNTTPNLTVKMTAKQIGRDERGDFYWHRFAMPVAGISSWDKEGSLVAADPEYTVQYPTYVYAWDYNDNDWKNIRPDEMEALNGYTLTLASDYIHVNGSGKVVLEGTSGGNLNALQDVTYTFKGNLVGNTNQPLNFTKEGFNFFGNSYTGYMHALTVLNGIESGNVDATVYMWNSESQIYVGISRYKLEKNRGLAAWQREVAPMQTFILRLRGADSADESVNYADAIWGNPRYGNAAPAPRRMLAEEEEEAYLEIKVTSANGKYDVVDFTEMASKTDAYEDSYDSEKYMNQKSINFYSTIGDMNFSSVVTNNLLGKTLSLQTMEETDYTLSFEYVEGKEYALRDKVTNDVIAITNDATYSFTAQPNATNENRFEIVSINEVPTAVENVETASKQRGIYTMLGQYVGEDFNALPAGVYIVNGVKIVK